jgi:paraquat-inducible protein A
LIPRSSVTACPGCDLLVKLPAMPDGHYMACGRCGTMLSKSCPNSIDRVAALSFAGLMLYPLAIGMPLMTLSSLGMKEQSSVLETAAGFYDSGYYIVSIITFLTAVIAPFLKLFIPFITSLCIKFGKRPPGLISAFKIHKHLEEWGMVEVFLLGILITLIKMGHVAQVHFNLGFFSFIGLVLLSISVSVCLDRMLFWSCLDRSEPAEDPPMPPDRDQTAHALGLMRCHDCGKLVDAAQDREPTVCPRCNSVAHFRTRASISKTWALVMTSLFLFIPANMLPIMQVNFLGMPERSTILDGIIYFLKHDSIAIGLIILMASILVPLFKIIGLMIMLVSIRSGKNRYLKQKSRMYRMIEFIGRWSMLDIFVVALLSALVDFGFLTSIQTEPGATFFCIVVVATMWAAIVFDPRILWDRCDPLDKI